MHFIAKISTQGFDFRIGPQISCDLAVIVIEQKTNLVDVRKCLCALSILSVPRVRDFAMAKLALSAPNLSPFTCYCQI